MAFLGGLVLDFAPLTALGWVSGVLAYAALVCLFLSTWVARRGHMRSTPGEEIPAIVHTYEPVETLPRSRK